MSISVGGTSSAYIDAITNQAKQNAGTNRASKVNSSFNNISAASSKEELTDAVKSFEQYFVEQILKEMKSSVNFFGADNSADGGMTDYYMDFAIEKIASQMIDQYGGRITEDFVAQIQRNYGITETSDTGNTQGSVERE